MLSIHCPHCDHALTDQELKRLFAQRNAKRRWDGQAPPAKKPAKLSTPPRAETAQEKIQRFLAEARLERERAKIQPRASVSRQNNGGVSKWE